MRGLYSHSREYRNILMRNCFPQNSQILTGNSFRREYMSRVYAHSCKYRTNSWRIIYVLVSCQGVLLVLPRLNSSLYHPFQNHYTYEILQLQLSEVFRINLHYSHSFLVVLTECIGIIPVGNYQFFSAITITTGKDTCAFFCFRTQNTNSIHIHIREQFWAPSILN